MTDVRTPRRDLSRAVFAVFVAAFLLRTLGPVWRSGLRPEYPDSFSFLDHAGIGPWWPSFWFGERPVGTPLVAWFLGRNTGAIVLVQSAAYALAVAVLGATLLRIVANRVIAWMAVVGVALLAVQPRFALWSLEVLSESLGLTLSLLALAAWLVQAHSPSRRRLVLAFAVTLAWLMVRDAHAVTVGVVALACLVASRSTSDSARRRLLRVGAVVLVLGVAYVAIAQNVSERNRYPLINTVGLRVLPDEDLANDWVERGMPMSDALRERAGSDSWSDGDAFLRDPRLADFRHWADGEGQRDQVMSLVLDAPHWLGEMRRDLPALLTYRFGDYDRYDAGDRLPEGSSWFDLPRTNASLALWLAVGFLAAVVVARKRRALGAVLGVALTATIVEAYTSYALDAVEVQRHMVGVLLRVGVIVVIAVALALGDAFPRAASRAAPITRTTAALVGAGTTLVFMAWTAIEFRSQDYDPQFARTVVERAARFGGSYYENGIHNKGPFEMVVYDAAHRVASYDSYWFAIAAFVIAIALVVAAASATVSRTLGAGRAAAVSAGVIAFIHLTFSSSDYAGVLYSRNITTGLLASAVVVVLTEWFWTSVRRARLSWVALALLVGLAVQTLLTSAFAAVAVVSLALVVRRHDTPFARPGVVFASTGIATVASAPVWYALRGTFDEFWSGWWTYASYMNSGLGRALRDQFGLGWQTFLGYHQDRPMLVVLYAVFAVIVRRRWHSLTSTQRALGATIAVWWFAAWIELILSQRYSSHYFSVLAVPTLLAIAFVIGAIAPLLPLRRALPLFVLVGSLAAQGTDMFWAGAESAGRFTGFADHTVERARNRSGESRTVHAVLDLVGRDGDPLLSWTMYPWTYLENHRVPATRFAWKSFLIGEIYLGRTSSDYVLPETRTWFAEDLAESRPRAYVHPVSVSLGGSDWFQRIVDRDFQPVLTTEQNELSIERGAWSELTRNPTGAARDVVVAADPVVIADDDCRSTGGRLPSLGADTSVTFWFRDADGSNETVALSLSSTRAWSSSESVEFASIPVALEEPEPFRLLIGARAAVLVIGDRIVGAVEIDGDTTVSATATGDVRLSEVRSGGMPAFAGC
ncbi:MAG: hypothetical protein B7C54_10940 [Acidimicrobiales bacterium mtb01]|nr:hypothetical protein [Actinomycetota bacterium]TEX45572.1 MAG: hypothetical protein B7C54_10940 [Acidimicrobiales bacterium mtb01]